MLHMDNKWLLKNPQTSASSPNKLLFTFYEPLAPAYPIRDILALDGSTGNIGIGTDNPLGTLHVGDDTGAGVIIENEMNWAMTPMKAAQIRDV